METLESQGFPLKKTTTYPGPGPVLGAKGCSFFGCQFTMPLWSSLAPKLEGPGRNGNEESNLQDQHVKKNQRKNAKKHEILFV